MNEIMFTCNFCVKSGFVTQTVHMHCVFVVLFKIVEKNKGINKKQYIILYTLRNISHLSFNGNRNWHKICNLVLILNTVK